MGLAFQPNYNNGVIVSPTATSDNILFGFTSETVVFTNLGDSIVYIAIGNSNNTVTASLADYPIVVGSQVSIGKDQDDDVVAFFAPAGSGSLHFINGIGI
jgi:hypothetical protein